MTDTLNPADEEDFLVALLSNLTRTTLRDEALAQVSPEDFHSPHHGLLWKAARALLEADERITRRALMARAHTAATERLLDRVAGMVPPAALFPRAVAEVIRCGRLRRLVEAADRIKQRAMIAEDHNQALGWALDELSNLDQSQTVPEVQAIGDLLAEFDRSMTAEAGEWWVIPTPWPDVNAEIAGGVHGGRMYVIGARPGEGKSIAAHQLAERAASLGHPAIVFSAEMGAMEVTGRVVAQGAGVELGEISRRDLSAHSYTKVAEYYDRAAGYPLFVVDKSDIGIPYIKSVCRAQKRRTGLRLVVVDYLQLIAADRGKPREQQVAEISRQLKILSRELDCAVIVPAQLNREAVKRGNRPNLSDLRESGAIEADADVVMLLSRKVITAEEDKERAGEYSHLLNVDIAKNRHGKVCGFELPWRAHYATIG